VCADLITIPQRPASLLMPAAGLVYRSFPALILVEHGDGPGLRLRRAGNSSKRRQTVGKRRAISELMVRTDRQHWVLPTNPAVCSCYMTLGSDGADYFPTVTVPAAKRAVVSTSRVFVVTSALLAATCRGPRLTCGAGAPCQTCSPLKHCCSSSGQPCVTAA
jgi:hypothetical protein